MTWWSRIEAIWSAWRDPLDVDFDSGFPDSDNWTDRTPLDSDCPDTQPTAPGLLDEYEDHPKLALPDH